MKKKIISLLLAALVLALAFTGCAAKPYSANEDMNGIRSEPSSSESFGSGMDYDMGMDNVYVDDSAADVPMYAPMEPSYSYSEGDIADIIAAASSTSQSEGRKMIYTAYADVETLEFDDTVQAVYAMLDRFGAYIESSSVTGTDYATTYYGNRSRRTADFAIRVPVQNYSNMSQSLTELGNVISYSSNSENISTRYTDVESRLKTYRTEYDRLIEMLAAADNVYDMVTVEQRISEVEYNIETLTSELRGMDDSVNYSTINLYVREVHELTEVKQEEQSFGAEIVEALKNSVKWLISALRTAAVCIIAALPWLILPAVLAVVIIIIVRVKIRKNRKLKSEGGEPENKDLQ